MAHIGPHLARASAGDSHGPGVEDGGRRSRPTQSSTFARVSLRDKTLNFEITEHVLLREHAHIG